MFSVNIHTSLSKRSFNWGDPTPKHQEWTVSYKGGPRMSIWPILTDNKHSLNFPGTFWTSCIHSPLSLLNYQVINLKSLWCSSLPHSRFSLKRKPIQRQSLEMERRGIPQNMCTPESSCAWSQCCSGLYWHSEKEKISFYHVQLKSPKSTEDKQGPDHKSTKMS